MNSSPLINAGSQIFVVGKNGFMFLTGGSHDVLSYITGDRPIPEKSLRNFKSNLTKRASNCSKRGMPYLHIVCPDKHSVLPEYFPFEIKNFLGDFFRVESGLDFLYPVSELQEIADGAAYMRTDTHWSVEGRLAATRAILKKFDLENGIESFFNEIRKNCVINSAYSGDLGNKMTPRITEAAAVYVPPTKIKQFSNGLTGNNGTIKLTFNASAPDRRLVLFGDSFIMSCIDILAEFFRYIMMIRSPFFHSEIMNMYRPTHVLTSNAERYLSGVPSDAGASISFLMADLTGRPCVPTPGYFDAFNAFLLPNSPVSRAFFDKLASGLID